MLKQEIKTLSDLEKICNKINQRHISNKEKAKKVGEIFDGIKRF